MFLMYEAPAKLEACRDKYNPSALRCLLMLCTGIFQLLGYVCNTLGLVPEVYCLQPPWHHDSMILWHFWWTKKKASWIANNFKLSFPLYFGSKIIYLTWIWSRTTTTLVEVDDTEKKNWCWIIWEWLNIYMSIFNLYHHLTLCIKLKDFLACLL